MTVDPVTYSGFAAPVGPAWKPVNGSRGRHRDQSVDIDMGVVHFWVSGESPPERFLNQLRTPALPGSGVCYQSTDGRGGWSWESPTGDRITDRTKARPYHGRTYDILRAGTDANGVRFPPLHLVDGDPMPWCYGPGYPVVLGTDGEFHFAANPDDIACNHAPPFNDRSIGAVFPGTYQTDEGWKDATSNAMIEALAKLIVYSYHRWGVPIRYCNVDDLLAGRTGWTGHRDVNEMQRRLGKTGVSRHGDPGDNCPWPRIIKRALELLNGDTMYVTIKGDLAAFSVRGGLATWIDSPGQRQRMQDDGSLPKTPVAWDASRLADYYLVGKVPNDVYPALTKITAAYFAGHLKAA